MARKQTGLGRGLGALIPQKEGAGTATAVKRPAERSEAAPSGAKRSVGAPSKQKKSTKKEQAALPAAALPEIALDQIHENPDQPRTFFGHQELEELTESVREHGIIQPLTLTPRREGGYTIVAGERRYRAAKMAGLKAVPALVRETEGSELLMLALIENIQRENLNPIEEAQAYERLIEDFTMTQDQVAKQVGKGRSTVANAVRLLSLPEEMREAIASGKIPPGSARALVSIEDSKKQMRLFRRLLAGATTRQAEAGARQAGSRGRRDVELEAFEQQLRDKYGTKATVTNRQGRGKVCLEFYSDEEFRSLIEALLK
ncbi:ParB/RepB/Spo0J family partition protein [Patescibacteria group bacterium]